MACPRPQQWQRRIRPSSRTAQVLTRSFTTSKRCHDEAAIAAAQPTTSPQPDSSLSILEHKCKPIRAPNDRLRSAAHAIDVAKRLGTRYSRPVIGTMEWQTSTYHYNKQTSKAYPVLANTTNKLLEAYALLSRKRTDAVGESVSSTQADIASRRKAAERVYVSPASVKDFGNRVVIDVFAYDAHAAAARSAAEREAGRAARAKPRAPKIEPGTPRQRTPGRGRTTGVGFKPSGAPRRR